MKKLHSCAQKLILPLIFSLVASPLPNLLAQAGAPSEIVGISVMQKKDTTIFLPKCNGDCPPDLLNRYLFEWDLGDCSKGFGNVVRHVYTQTPTDPVTLRALAIYDEDEDPEEMRVTLENPKVVPLPPKTFAINARFSRSPVPGDRVDIAVRLDQNFAPGSLVGNLRVSERSPFLDIPVPDTSAIADCGRLSLRKVRSKGKTLSLDTLENLAEGPSSLLFRYSIPNGLKVGEDTISIVVRFTGTADGVAIDTSIILSEAVKGSHDPNTKVADPPEYFLPGQFITYTVFFQNIGTAAAKKVVISDFLDSLFDIHSVQVLRTEIAGEPKKFEVKIVDRQLIFSYESERKGRGDRDQKAILAPSSLDEEKSKGLIRFRVRTLDTIGCFDHIANAAAIVFDQNPAFVTRCVVHKRFCDCQEYCNWLGYNGFPEFGEELSDSLPASRDLVPVLRTGTNNQIQTVRPTEFGAGQEDPTGPPLDDPLRLYRLLLIAAGVLVLVLLVLYIRK